MNILGIFFRAILFWGTMIIVGMELPKKKNEHDERFSGYEKIVMACPQGKTALFRMASNGYVLRSIIGQDAKVLYTCHDAVREYCGLPHAAFSHTGILCALLVERKATVYCLIVNCKNGRPVIDEELPPLQQEHVPVSWASGNAVAFTADGKLCIISGDDEAIKQPSFHKGTIWFYRPVITDSSAELVPEGVVRLALQLGGYLNIRAFVPLHDGRIAFVADQWDGKKADPEKNPNLIATKLSVFKYCSGSIEGWFHKASAQIAERPTIEGAEDERIMLVPHPKVASLITSIFAAQEILIHSAEDCQIVRKITLKEPIVTVIASGDTPYCALVTRRTLEPFITVPVLSIWDCAKESEEPVHSEQMAEPHEDADLMAWHGDTWIVNRQLSGAFALNAKNKELKYDEKRLGLFRFDGIAKLLKSPIGKSAFQTSHSPQKKSPDSKGKLRISFND